MWLAGVTQVYCFAGNETILSSCGTRVSFRLARIGTKRADRAIRTTRGLRNANAATVVLQKMAEPYSLLLRYQRRQIEFDLVGIGVLCKSKPL